jgi:hypothetical protein
MDVSLQRLRRRLAPQKSIGSFAAREPIRAELFSIDLLKHHAAALG